LKHLVVAVAVAVAAGGVVAVAVAVAAAAAAVAVVVAAVPVIVSREMIMERIRVADVYALTTVCVAACRIVASSAFLARQGPQHQQHQQPVPAVGPVSTHVPIRNTVATGLNALAQREKEQKEQQQW
jgi:hypothetical protein